MPTDLSKPTYQIHVLKACYLDPPGDASFLCHNYSGEKKGGPVYAFLITGENIPPILVDTAIKEDQYDMMHRLGMNFVQPEEWRFKPQLARLGYTPEDIKLIIHTHLHIDHSGNDDLFPNASIIIARKEMMWSVSGIQGPQYPPENISYLVTQLHVPGRVRLIDNDMELVPGIRLEITQGHTMGNLVIKVNTKDGLAIICGDIIYDEVLQCRENKIFTEIGVQNKNEFLPFGEHASGNFCDLWANIAAIQKVMHEADILLPSHDALVEEKYGFEIG